MDVPADDSRAALLRGDLHQMLLEVADVGDRGLDFLFDPLRDRVVGQPAAEPSPVVEAVEPHERRVAHVAHLGEPPHRRGDVVEDVAVQHVVAFVAARVDVLLQDADVGELQGQDAVQKVVVVAAQVDDVCVVLDVEQAADEVRVAAFPLLAAPADELPAVDDVAAENQRVAGMASQETVGLLGLRPLRSEVDVGHDDGLEMSGWCHLTLFDTAKKCPMPFIAATTV